MVVFTDDAWIDGEGRAFLAWDYIEVPGLYLSLRRKVRTQNLGER